MRMVEVVPVIWRPLKPVTVNVGETIAVFLVYNSTRQLI